LTPIAPESDDDAMSLPRIKLTLPPDLREYVDRRVTLGGYVNAGEYMRQLIRMAAADQHRQRLGDRLAARKSGLGDTADGDTR
jgi:Arc/MetJ-type ribon-helix-helix transcriptional regulator